MTNLFSQFAGGTPIAAFLSPVMNILLILGERRAVLGGLGGELGDQFDELRRRGVLVALGVVNDPGAGFARVGQKSAGHAGVGHRGGAGVVGAGQEGGKRLRHGNISGVTQLHRVEVTRQQMHQLFDLNRRRCRRRRLRRETGRTVSIIHAIAESTLRTKRAASVGGRAKIIGFGWWWWTLVQMGVSVVEKTRFLTRRWSEMTVVTVSVIVVVVFAVIW